MIEKINPVGGNGGGDFALETPNMIKSIEIRHGGWIDAIAITDYDGNQKHTGGGGGGGQASVFTLEDGEYLTEVSGKYGDFIGQITLKTNKGKTATYGAAGGNTGSNNFNWEAGSGKAIIGFYGKAGGYIDSLGVMVSDIPSIDTSSIPGL